jgi:hypothetical protein
MSDAADAQLPVPVAGTRTLAQPLVVELVIDESGSTSESDPDGRRHDHADAIAEWLARHSGNPADRLGIVRFANQATRTQTFPVAVAARRIGSELRFGPMPTDGTYTNLTPAVDNAVAALAPYPGYRKVVIILSDFAISESEAQVRGLMRRLRGTADSVYLGALDADGVWTGETHRLFDHVGTAGKFVLDGMSDDALASSVTLAIVSETGQELAR